MIRLLLSGLVALGILAASPVARAQEPQGKTPTVLLSVRERDDLKEGMYDGILFREIFRQAFLIAARDELGLSTRDQTLRDEVPVWTKAVPISDSPFEVVPTVETGSVYKVRIPSGRRLGNKSAVLSEKNFEIPEKEFLSTLVEKGEELSRTEFRELLVKEKMPALAKPAREKSEIPAAVAELLYQWNEIAQFTAIRALHAECRANGDSPELLAALAISYANLGSLTEYFWSPAHKAFKARGLLYAERLVRRTEKSPWAVAHRAYVRTLTGMHTAADADLKSIQDKKGQKDADGREIPEWVGMLEHFAAGNLPPLAEAKEKTDSGRVARYLHLLAVEFIEWRAELRDSVARVLADTPDSFRAADAVYYYSSKQTKEATTQQSIELDPSSLTLRLAPLKDGSKAIEEYIAGRKLTDDFDAELRHRAKLIAALKATDDSTEISLSTLGRMIEESAFVHVFRVMDTNRELLHTPCDEMRELFRPVYEKHRWAAFFDYYADDKKNLYKATDKLSHATDVSELELTGVFMYRWVYWYNKSTGKTAWLHSVAHADPIYRDQFLLYKYRSQSNSLPEDDEERNRELVRKLAVVSPNLPVVMERRIRRDWDAVKSEAGVLEKRFWDDSETLAEIAWQYLETKRWDDAIRTYSRLIEISPNIQWYHNLSEAYEGKGDAEGFKKTLLAAAELPSNSALRRAEMLTNLAEFYERRKEFKEGLKYAEDAAETWDGAPIQCAARLHEKLGNWKEAEEWMKKLANHYEDGRNSWLMWCARTGHGDFEAASKLAYEHFEALEQPLPTRELERIGFFYLLTKEPDKAFEVFQEAFRQEESSYVGFFIALLADEMGKTDVRDATLQKIVENGKKKGKDRSFIHYGTLAEMLLASLKSEKEQGTLDPAAINTVLKLMAEGNPTNCDYLIGMFLKQRGKDQQSQEYLKRAAESPERARYAYVLACRELRERNIAIGKTRRNEIEY